MKLFELFVHLLCVYLLYVQESILIVCCLLFEGLQLELIGKKVELELIGGFSRMVLTCCVISHLRAWELLCVYLVQKVSVFGGHVASLSILSYRVRTQARTIIASSVILEVLSF